MTLKKLREYTIHDLHISGVTEKAIEKDGVYPGTLIRALIIMGKLNLLYEVPSSIGENRHFGVGGQKFDFLSRNGYSVNLKFDSEREIGSGFSRLPYAQQELAIRNVINNCDVTVQCDCGSFYWQGMWEDDSEITAPKFVGTKGKGIWRDIHNQSGNVQGQQICKHIHSVLDTIYQDIPTIIKMMASQGI